MHLLGVTARASGRYLTFGDKVLPFGDRLSSRVTGGSTPRLAPARYVSLTPWSQAVTSFPLTRAASGRREADPEAWDARQLAIRDEMDKTHRVAEHHAPCVARRATTPVGGDTRVVYCTRAHLRANGLG